MSALAISAVVLVVLVVLVGYVFFKVATAGFVDATLFEGRNVCAACGKPLIAQDGELMRVLQKSQDSSGELLVNTPPLPPDLAASLADSVRKITIKTVVVGTSRIDREWTLMFHKACYELGEKKVSKTAENHRMLGGIMIYELDPRAPY